MPRRVLVVVALAALALGVLWCTQAASEVRTYEEVRVSDPWTERATLEYFVPLERAMPDRPEGTVLGMGEPGYFTTVAPRAMLSFSWAVSDPRSTHVTSTARLVVSAAGDIDGIPWTLERELAALGGSARAQAEGVLDVPALLDASRSAQNVTWRVIARVGFLTDARGVATSEFEFPLLIQEPLYVLPPAADLEWSREHGERAVLTTHERPGLAAILDRPGAIGMAVAGVVLLVVVWRDAEGSR